VMMDKVAGSNNLYKVDINSALDNVIFNNNGSNQTETINGIANNNTFIVYPDNGYNSVTLGAATFIDSYMKFETKWLDNKGDGSCKSSGWYSAAKSAFSSKTASEKSDILAHEPTKYRLAAWATANEETFNESTGTFSSNNQTIAIIENSATNTTIIIVVISTLSLVALGGFFFIKRRKESK
ncbi:MAG: LPXTG cell wall anchor domain-containing protein, partial [Bacilli bacterium]|nr:LPXTG cell wall anchor domain-containing protein [Bacilli bacterium]